MKNELNIPIEEPEENWTKYPNCILENLDKFTSAEIHVISLIIRKNKGWKNPNKQFSAGYVSKKTGLSKPTVIKAIDGLENKKSIICIGTESRGVKLYDINWINNLTSKESLPVTSKEFLPDPVKILYPVLDTRVKENDSKIKHIEPEIKSQSLTTYIKNYMDEQQYKLTAEHIIWNGNAQRYGKNLKDIVKIIEENYSGDDTRRKVAKQKIDELAKWGAKYFNFTNLLTKWNNLIIQPVRKIDPSPAVEIEISEEAKQIFAGLK